MTIFGVPVAYLCIIAALLLVALFARILYDIHHRD